MNQNFVNCMIYCSLEFYLEFTMFTCFLGIFFVGRERERELCKIKSALMLFILNCCHLFLLIQMDFGTPFFKWIPFLTIFLSTLIILICFFRKCNITTINLFSITKLPYEIQPYCWLEKLNISIIYFCFLPTDKQTDSVE